MRVEPGRDSEGRLRNAVLIAGPTASGKSQAAMRLAEEIGGALINADSMQGYVGLRIITARPTPADEARLPHHLYGHVPPQTAYSTGAWLRDVMRLIDSGVLHDRVPIFVGGTGLYFRALLDGLSEMPEIPPHVRERWRYKLMEEGPERLHKVLQREDPDVATRLRPGDGQRIVRALEVLETSGRSIMEWQAISGRPIIDPGSARRFVTVPDRAEIVGRIDARIDGMIAEGVVGEAKAFMALGLDPALPSMKAIALREFAAAAEKQVPISVAAEHARIATRQYAKRQATWFRNQLGREWVPVGTNTGQSLCERMQFSG